VEKHQDLQGNIGIAITWLAEGSQLSYYIKGRNFGGNLICQPANYDIFLLNLAGI